MKDILEDLARRSVMHSSMWTEISAVPKLRDWSDLRAHFIAAIGDTFARWIGPTESHFREQVTFAVGRFDEGAGLVRYFERYEPRLDKSASMSVLDVGGGNGGVALAMSNCTRFRVHALDVVPNADLALLRQQLGMPVEQLVGNGEVMPFAKDTFDIVLLLDTIEHVGRRAALGAEIKRILAPGGMCMITTPARLRHLVGPDPHYGIRGLVALPMEYNASS